MAVEIPCPACGCDLPDHVSDPALTDWVMPSRDPEGLARLDLILECEECGARLNAFVPLRDFQLLEE